MRLLQTAFLPAAHRVAVIDTGTLDPCKPGFQRFGITKLRAPVGKNVFKQCLKIISTKALFQPVKDKPYSTLCVTVHQESKKQLFPCKKKVSSVFDDPEAECTVSISTKEDSPNCWKSV